MTFIVTRNIFHLGISNSKLNCVNYNIHVIKRVKYGY